MHTLDRVSLKGEEALECMCFGYQFEVDCVYVHTQTHTHKHTYCPCVRHVNTCWHFMNVISHVLVAHNRARFSGKLWPIFKHSFLK